MKSRWKRWNPRRTRSNVATRMQIDESVPTLYLSRSARDSAQLTEFDHHEVSQRDSTIDRHTSIRSVATLPAYSQNVRDNEQLLGREGERAGIDVVLESAETAEEEEARREEEMSSLYNIRQQRRQEIEEREDRRRRRREARERGDMASVMQIRQESMLSAHERELRGAAAMIAEHQSRSRERRVSSVSYGDLGVARHDGSRVRGGSMSSDRQPLLDSAASISGLSTAAPAVTRDSLSTHIRGRSTSSLMSGLSGDGESEYEMPPFGRAGSDFEVVTMNQIHSRNGSRTITPVRGRSRASSAVLRPSVDTLDHRPATHEPPTYEPAGFEEAPPYVSPATERARGSFSSLPQIQTHSETGAPLLPEISRLPSIRIAEATPIEPRPSDGHPLR